jgi:phospholipid-binding lipoprotein MlaA
MKMKSFFVLLLSLFAFGCAHHSAVVSDATKPAAETTVQKNAVHGNNPAPKLPESVASAAAPAPPVENPAEAPVRTAETLPSVSSQISDADIAGDYVETDEGAVTEARPGADGSEKEMPGNQPPGLTIADPLEPFNRAMFQFNDKLYFWVLKPVSQGYKWLVHEDVRAVIGNFFSNAAFPVRFVNCLLQANLPGAGSELGRFLLNTAVGFGGLFDPASDPEINLAKHREDLGQTLGAYGIGQGFYIHWPIFGPSSPRDTIGKAGDGFLNPFSWLDEWYETAGVRTFDMVNDTSFRIGDYEALKKAAIDPYIAVRDAYVQYRASSVKTKAGFFAPVNGAGQKKRAP